MRRWLLFLLNIDMALSTASTLVRAARSSELAAQPQLPQLRHFVPYQYGEVWECVSHGCVQAGPGGPDVPDLPWLLHSAGTIREAFDFVLGYLETIQVRRRVLEYR